MSIDLTDRHTYLGASEIAGALGLSLHDPAFEVWARKTGRTKYKEVTGDIKRGIALEPHAIQEVGERDDVHLVVPAGQIQAGRYRKMASPKEGICRAHPDGEIEMEHPTLSTPGRGLLEVKCPRSTTFARIKEQGLPPENILQLQLGMQLGDYEWGAFAVHTAEDWETLLFPMERDPNLDLVHLGNEWWETYVETDVPPPAISEKAPMVTAIGGELVYVAPDNEKWVELMEQYTLYRDTKKALEEMWKGGKEEDAEPGLKDRIIAMMEDDLKTAVAEGAGWKIRLNQEYTSNRFNQDLLAELGPFDPERVQQVLEEHGIKGPELQTIMGTLGLTGRIDAYDKERFYARTTPSKVITGWRSKIDE